MQKQSKYIFSGVLAFFSLFLTVVLGTQMAYAMTVNFSAGNSATINWAGTGSSPYSLSRDGSTVYSGSSTTYEDHSAQYNKSYTYNLSYQNYEQTGGGYYSSGEYWGVTVPGHYTTEYYSVPWCAGTDSYGIYYSHSPPCDTSAHSTTKLESHQVWVDDQYGWIPYSYWVPAQYGYVPRSTAVSVIPPVVTLSNLNGGSATVSIRPGSSGGTAIRTEYYLAGSSNTAWTTYSAPFQIANAGQTTIYARTIDNAGNSSPWGTLSPPTVSILSVTSDGASGDNVIIGRPGTFFVPQISVLDMEGDSLDCKYYLDDEASPRGSKTITNTATAQVVAFDAVAFDGLSEGPHSLKVVVSDNKASVVTKSNPFQIDKTAPVITDAAAVSAETSITVTAAAIDSGSGLAAAPYRFTAGAYVSAWTTGTHTINGLTPDTLYNVQVEARDKVDRTAVKQLSLYTKAQAPTVSVQSLSSTSLEVKLSDSNPAATQYQIKVGSQYVAASGALSETPAWITATNKRVVITGLKSATPYSVQAAAVNREGVETSVSGTVNGMTLAEPPGDMVLTPKQVEINVSWPAIESASGYDIEVDGQIIHNGTSTSYLHTGLSPESSHTYRVRVQNAGGLSSWSKPFTKFTLPYPPAIPGHFGETPSQTFISLMWDRVAKADRYEIEADGRVINTGSETTYTHSNLEPETPHQYRVRAINSGGTGLWSNILQETTLPYPPAVPEPVTGVQAIFSITINWDEVPAATSYEIEADGQVIALGNQINFVDEGLEPLSGHVYRVRAVNRGGKSDWSRRLNISTYPEKPLPPANIIASSDSQAITMTWFRSLNADHYEVEIDGGDIASVKNPQYIHSALSPNTRHMYRVRAVNVSGLSDWSSKVILDTLPASTVSNESLTNAVAVITNKSILISWNAVAPDVSYDIEVDGKLIDLGKNTTYSHTGLKPKEYHTYKIRVRDNQDQENWVSVLSLATLPDPPDAFDGVSAYATDYSIQLVWNKISDATSYEIEVDGHIKDAGNASNYTDDGLESGTSHTYRVRAKNETGVSAWSNAIVKSTTTPVYTIAVAKEKPVFFSLLASDVQDFSELTYVVTYDPNKLEVTDLDDFTPQKERMGEGDIGNTGIHVIYKPGRIEYTVKKNIVPGTSWSGEITTIQFAGKADGESDVKLTVE